MTLGSWVKLGSGVKLGNEVTLGDEVTLGNSVKLGNEVTLGDGVTLGSWVTLGDEVTLGNSVTLGDWVKLGNGVMLGKTPCQIQLHPYIVYPHSPQKIGVGCIVHELDYWLREQDPDELANHQECQPWSEYRAAIEFVAARMPF